jgi:hypothetical protein
VWFIWFASRKIYMQWLKLGGLREIELTMEEGGVRSQRRRREDSKLKLLLKEVYR